MLINAAIITAASLFLRILAITVNVYISDKIGAEGMGLYQLILSVFMMPKIFVVSGISLAVTRLMSEEKKHLRSDWAILKHSFNLSLILSVIGFAVLYFGAGFFGNVILKDERTILSLRVLAPSMPFMAISAVYKGYFFAERKAFEPTAAQVFEQISEFVCIIIFFAFYKPISLEDASAVIVFGITFSEIMSALFLHVSYKLEKRGSRGRRNTQKGIMKRLIKITMPVSTSACIRSALKTAENVMIPQGLLKYGASYKTSLEEYGIITGMAMPLIFFPSVLISSFSTLLVPELSEANAQNHQKRIKYIVTTVLFYTSILTTLVTGIYIVFADELGMAVYESVNVGRVLRFLAPLIPFIYFDMIVDGMLNGLDLQVSSLRYNIIDSCVRIVLIYYLIPLKGVWGYIIVLFVGSILNTFLSIRSVLRVSNIKVDFKTWLLKPVLAVAAAFAVVSILPIAVADIKMTLTIHIILICVFYFVFLLILGCITKRDILWFFSFFKNRG